MHLRFQTSYANLQRDPTDCALNYKDDLSVEWEDQQRPFSLTSLSKDFKPSSLMRKAPMKKSLLIFVLAIFVASTAFSQGRVLDPKTKEALKELYKGVRGYAQENIIPKMKVWKGTLDHSMNAEDLGALNALRDRAAQLKAKGKRLTVAMRKAVVDKNTADIRKYRQMIKALSAERLDLLKDLKPLGVKYKATLEGIGKEAKPYGKEWKEGIKKIGYAWFQSHKADLTPKFKAVLGKAMERLKKFTAVVDRSKMAKIAVAKFMLWDGKDLPEANQMLIDEAQAPETSDTTSPEGYALEANYPNPFNPSTKISFTLPKADHVSLVVFDMLGKEVMTLVDSDLGAGTHSITFDGKNLASGTYIYRIRSGAFVQERTMQLIK
jgi:hypothetical protein